MTKGRLPNKKVQKNSGILSYFVRSETMPGMWGRWQEMRLGGKKALEALRAHGTRY